MAVPLIAAGIAGAAGLVGNLIQNRANRKAAERGYAKELELMKYQNEYNAPKNQMARLREAGLSPMLAYGGGNISGNLTGSMPSYQEAPKQFDMEQAVQSGIKTYREVNYTNILKAQEDKMLQDIELTKQLRVNEAIKADLLSTQNVAESEKLAALPDLMKYSLELKKLTNQNVERQIENAYKTGELRDSELETKKLTRASIIASIAEKVANTKYRNKLLEMLGNGITPSDPFYVRVVQSIMKEMGIESWSDFFDSFNITNQ